MRNNVNEKVNELIPELKYIKDNYSLMSEALEAIQSAINEDEDNPSLKKFVDNKEKIEESNNIVFSNPEQVIDVINHILSETDKKMFKKG